MDRKQLMELRQRLVDARAEGKKALERATALEAMSDPSAEEVAELATLNASMESLESEIPAIEIAITTEEKRLDRQATFAAVAVPAARGTLEVAVADYLERVRDGALPVIDDPNRFASFGEQLLAVFNAAQTPGAADPRLFAAAQGLQESVGADGGFLVQTEFSAELIRMVHETGLLASRTRVIPAGAGANAITIPSVDETSRVDGSRWGGVQAFWDGEAEQFTRKAPKFSKIELKLSKLTGLAYATDEMLADATALGAIIQAAFVEEFGFKMDDAIFRGTGAGMPLGFFNSDAKIVVAKETSQVAATINEKNVLKMWARMPATLRLGSVWLINQDAEPQLPQMVIGNQPVYLPAGGLSGQGFGSLMGRPVLPVEQADTVGQEGDFCLVNLNEYITYEKGALETATSIHVRFEFGEQAFRFVLRADGKPRWKSSVTPFKGTNKISPFITLAVRA